MKPPCPLSLSACALALLVAAAGCSSAPVYRLESGRIHKDLVICNVRLSQTLDAEEYSRIASGELAGLLASPVATVEDGVPLYEVRFEFLVSNQESDRFRKVATVRFSLQTPDDPPSVILYPDVF